MALNRLTHSQFNRKIQFGMTKTSPNLNTGGSKVAFVPTEGLNLWCAPYTRAITNSYGLSAEALTTSVVIIRHNDRVNDTFRAMYQGDLYDVINDSPDESNNYRTFDYVTIRKMSKG